MRCTALGMFVALSLVAPPAEGQTHGLALHDDAFFDMSPLAERVRMHLSYAGAPGCAEAELFKDAVRVREYRWEPFAPFSRWRLAIQVTRHGPGYSGSGELRTPAGTMRWRHTLRGPYRCYDLIAALALEVVAAIALPPDPPPPAPTCPEPPRDPAPQEDPACSSSSSSSSPPGTDSRYAVWPVEWPLPPLPKPKPDPPPPPESWPLAIRIGIGVWSEVIVSGWGSLGLSADVGVRYRAFSASVELHGDPPLGSVLTQHVPVTFARLSGALLLCAHFGWFVGCGVGDAGRSFFPNQAQPLPASTFYGTAGVRVGLDFPVVPRRIFLRAALDMRASIPPMSFTSKGSNVFASAGPSVGLGLGVLAELPP